MEIRDTGSRGFRARALLGVVCAAVLAACSLSTNRFTPEGDPPDMTGPSCTDGLTNGRETDVDCGGDCSPCAIGQICDAGTDCVTGSCQNASCQAPSCTDGIANGRETDIDCGGDCGPCAIGQICAAGADCVTRACQDLLCRAASCGDGVQNGDETALDCGGSCGRCGDGQPCLAEGDCQSGVCADATCQVASCGDGVQNGNEAGADCGGGCRGCGVGGPCQVDLDCGDSAICDAQVCRVASSCNEIKQRYAVDGLGVYSIAPAGVAFDAVCDMTTDGGGWTLLLKADDPIGADETNNGASLALAYDAPAWTSFDLIAPDDLTVDPGTAKYQSFVDLPITTLVGVLDGYRFHKDFTGQTAREIFDGGPSYTLDYTQFKPGDPTWRTQPFCQTFGVNTDYDYGHVRFGFTANQEDTCASNDTAIGLGLKNTFNAIGRSAGYQCLSSTCTLPGDPTGPDLGTIDQAGAGLLWGR
jgi:hypothetical protein